MKEKIIFPEEGTQEPKVKTEKLKQLENTNKWLTQYRDNYLGKSEEAKELEGFTKRNYKENVYIPWAVMERLMLMQDPDALLNIVRNEDNGIIFTESEEVLQKRVADGVVKEETFSLMFSHFVKVELVFLGKYFVEEYPIQDEKYEAARIYNQNLVNRAVQRAKAKIIARGTGLALKLYEGKDLQFDEVVTPEAPTAKDPKPLRNMAKDKVEKVVEEIKAEEKVEVAVLPKVEKISDTVTTVVPEEIQAVKVETNDDVETLIGLIKNTPSEKIIPTLQMLNVSILKAWGFVLSQNDTVEELREKISKFVDVTKFIKVIRTKIGE